MRIYVLLLYVFPTIVRSIFSFFPWPPATVAVPSSSSSSSRSPRILHSTVQRLTRNRTDCIVCAGIFFFFSNGTLSSLKYEFRACFTFFVRSSVPARQRRRRCVLERTTPTRPVKSLGRRAGRLPVFRYFICFFFLFENSRPTTTVGLMR